MGSHESTVVVRMPEDLKSRLKIEAKKLGIPVVAIVDTNCSPDGTDSLPSSTASAMPVV